MEDFVEKLVNLLVKEGIVNEESLRNYRIKSRFQQLHEADGMKVEDCFEKIAAEFSQYNIQPRTVRHIIYEAKR